MPTAKDANEVVTAVSSGFVCTYPLVDFDWTWSAYPDLPSVAIQASTRLLLRQFYLQYWSHIHQALRDLLLRTNRRTSANLSDRLLDRWYYHRRVEYCLLFTGRVSMHTSQKVMGANGSWSLSE